jgi:hypothetical protein
LSNWNWLHKHLWSGNSSLFILSNSSLDERLSVLLNWCSWDNHIFLTNRSEQVILACTCLDFGLEISLNVCFHLVNIDCGGSIICCLKKLCLWRISSGFEGSLFSLLLCLFLLGKLFSFFFLNKSIMFLLSILKLLLLAESSYMDFFLLFFASLTELDHFAKNALLLLEIVQVLVLSNTHTLIKIHQGAYCEYRSTLH